MGACGAPRGARSAAEPPSVLLGRHLRERRRPWACAPPPPPPARPQPTETRPPTQPGPPEAAGCRAQAARPGDRPLPEGQAVQGVRPARAATRRRRAVPQALRCATAPSPSHHVPWSRACAARRTTTTARVPQAAISSGRPPTAPRGPPTPTWRRRWGRRRAAAPSSSWQWGRSSWTCRRACGRRTSTLRLERASGTRRARGGGARVCAARGRRLLTRPSRPQARALYRRLLARTRHVKVWLLIIN